MPVNPEGGGGGGDYEPAQQDIWADGQLARQLRLKRRRRGLAGLTVDVGDFYLEDTGRHDFEHVWRSSNDCHFTPYAVDPDKKEVLFVQTGPEVDVAAVEAPFYLLQYKAATAAYSVPYLIYHDLASKLAAQDVEKGGGSASPSFVLYSTGNCKTSVFCKAIACSDVGQCLSEPGIYLQLVRLYRLGRISEEDAMKLLASTTHFLTAFLREHDCSKPVSVIRLQPTCLGLAGALQEALPSVKQCLIYRAARTAIPLHAVQLSASWQGWLLKATGLDQWGVALTSPEDRLWLAPLSQTQPLPSGSSAVVLAALMWLSVMDDVQSLTSKFARRGKRGPFFHWTARFEDLFGTDLRRRESFIGLLFHRMGLRISNAALLQGILGSGSGPGQSEKPPEQLIKAHEFALMESLLDQYEALGVPNLDVEEPCRLPTFAEWKLIECTETSNGKANGGST